MPLEVVSIRVVAEGRLPGPLIDAIRDDSAEQARPPGLAKERKVYFAGKGFLPTPIHFRPDLQPGTRLEGPVVIQEYGSTTLLHPGDRLTVEPNGVMTIAIGAAAS